MCWSAYKEAQDIDARNHSPIVCCLSSSIAPPFFSACLICSTDGLAIAARLHSSIPVILLYSFAAFQPAIFCSTQVIISVYKSMVGSAVLCRTASSSLRQSYQTAMGNSKRDLVKNQVDEFDDIKIEFLLRSFFTPHEFFENEKIEKEYNLGDTLTTTGTTVRWKQGKNVGKRGDSSSPLSFF
ncbi:hypothetical protein Q1695_003327 [Nippostrongylus brasiliensis]|nr:hypothetical protein Q1695_003327 [Nippostrongylus brasiliensis]